MAKTVFLFHYEGRKGNFRLLLDADIGAIIEQLGADGLGNPGWFRLPTHAEQGILPGSLAAALHYALLFKVAPGETVVVGRYERGKLTIEVPEGYEQLLAKATP